MDNLTDNKTTTTKMTIMTQNQRKIITLTMKTVTTQNNITNKKQINKQLILRKIQTLINQSFPHQLKPIPHRSATKPKTNNHNQKSKQIQQLINKRQLYHLHQCPYYNKEKLNLKFRRHQQQYQTSTTATQQPYLKKEKLLIPIPRCHQLLDLSNVIQQETHLPTTKSTKQLDYVYSYTKIASATLDDLINLCHRSDARS